MQRFQNDTKVRTLSLPFFLHFERIFIFLDNRSLFTTWYTVSSQYKANFIRLTVPYRNDKTFIQAHSRANFKVWPCLLCKSLGAPKCHILPQISFYTIIKSETCTTLRRNEAGTKWTELADKGRDYFSHSASNTVIIIIYSGLAVRLLLVSFTSSHPHCQTFLTMLSSSKLSLHLLR